MKTAPVILCALALVALAGRSEAQAPSPSPVTCSQQAELAIARRCPQQHVRRSRFCRSQVQEQLDVCLRTGIWVAPNGHQFRRQPQ
jgi:hypothetical protein